jgi:hypothetical protein
MMCWIIASSLSILGAPHLALSLRGAPGDSTIIGAGGVVR